MTTRRQVRRLAHGGSGERCGGCCGFLGSSKCEKGAGKGSRGSEEGLGSLFVEAGARGRAPTTRDVGAVAQRLERAVAEGRGRS